MELQGKVAVITGAASGIGWATASLFAELGATVIGVDADEARLRRLAALGPSVHAVHADITDAGAPTAVIERAEGVGGPMCSSTMPR